MSLTLVYKSSPRLLVLSRAGYSYLLPYGGGHWDRRVRSNHRHDLSAGGSFGLTRSGPETHLQSKALSNTKRPVSRVQGNTRTFDRVRLAVCVGVAIPIPRPFLALQLLVESPIGILVVPSSAQTLVVVENGGAYGLFRPVLADDILVDARLQVAWIELGDAIAWLEDGAPASVLGWIVAACKAGVEVIRPSGQPSERTSREQSIPGGPGLWRRRGLRAGGQEG